MMFFEVYVPKGALSLEQRARLGERLIGEFLTAEETATAPAEVVAAGQAIQQVVFHEVEPWIVGTRRAGVAEPPRYVVRLSVPGAWRKEMSATAVERVTRVLASMDAELGLSPRRLYEEPAAWVHVLGVPEGGLGAFGRVQTSADLVRLITAPFRESPDRDALVGAAAPGTALDPICGMTVELDAGAITFERDGQTYGFCSPGCLQVFKEDRR